MTSLSGNRAARLKRRLEDRKKPKPEKDKVPKMDPYKRVKSVNLDTWDEDSEG